jgi:aminoglycoside phosphotransferase (APT) family kinase protein
MKDELLANMWPMMQATMTFGFTSLAHGDPRMDNFYFDGERTGLLDWQLMLVGNIATDISWVLCFHDLPMRFPADCDRLVDGYFARLQVIGDYASSAPQSRLFCQLSAARAAGAGRCEGEERG